MPDNLMAFSDLVIQRFSGPQAAPFTEEDARGYFAGQRSARLGGQEVQLALVGPEEEEVVPGSASAYALNLEQRSAVVGYWPEPQGRGRGVTSTEVRLLATWGHDAGVGSDRADVWTG